MNQLKVVIFMNKLFKALSLTVALITILSVPASAINITVSKMDGDMNKLDTQQLMYAWDVTIHFPDPRIPNDTFYIYAGTPYGFECEQYANKLMNWGDKYNKHGIAVRDSAKGSRKYIYCIMDEPGLERAMLNYPEWFYTDKLLIYRMYVLGIDYPVYLMQNRFTDWIDPMDEIQYEVPSQFAKLVTIPNRTSIEVPYSFPVRILPDEQIDVMFMINYFTGMKRDKSPDPDEDSTGVDIPYSLPESPIPFLSE
jgi:hypothetical protein